jgi:pyruvate formate lyase activating enzyme
MREGSFYERRDDGRTACQVCPHLCVISPGDLGKCKVRRNDGGRLVSINYGRVTSVALDPVEKKPLYHFYPGSVILSMGTWGCNFHCDFCQNWEISQAEALTEGLTPADGAKQAGDRGSIGIAYTYNEPTIWVEHVLESARLVRGMGLKNVLVTNGFINLEPLDELLDVVDALNIDIKSMSDAFYRKLTGGRLAPVLAATVRANAKAHVEVTYLVISTLNDKTEELEAFGKWVAENLGEETPCHLSAYFPRFRLKLEATPLSVLQAARETVGQYVKHVYLGNVAGGMGQDTLCAGCGALLVSRRGYVVEEVGLKRGSCSACGKRLRGHFAQG